MLEEQHISYAMCFSNKIVICLYYCPRASPNVLPCLGNPGHQFVKSTTTGSCAVSTFAEYLEALGTYQQTFTVYLQWSCKWHNMWVSLLLWVVPVELFPWIKQTRTFCICRVRIKARQLHNTAHLVTRCFLLSQGEKNPLLFFIQCNNAMVYNL